MQSHGSMSRKGPKPKGHTQLGMLPSRALQELPATKFLGGVACYAPSGQKYLKSRSIPHAILIPPILELPCLMPGPALAIATPPVPAVSPLTLRTQPLAKHLYREVLPCARAYYNITDVACAYYSLSLERSFTWPALQPPAAHSLCYYACTA